MTAWLTRNGFTIAVLALVFGIIAVGSFLVVTAGPDVARVAFGEPAAAASPTPVPSASPESAMARSPIGIEIPAGSDCNACHTTDGTIGTKPIPVMGHPLFGWRDCTACHSTGSLVSSAPGHSGLHKDECLVCHKTRTEAGLDSPAPPRPEHMGTTKPCVACHGVDKHAPLPDAMAGRDNCWICHNGKEFNYLFEEGSPGASPDTGIPSPLPSPSADAGGTQGAIGPASDVAWRLAADPPVR